MGGPGKQCWSDGRNWPLPVLTPDDWNYQNMQWLDDNHDLFGQWRIEVTPDKPNKDDVFLHLLQVGDTSLRSMSNSTVLKTDEMVGTSFVHEDKEYEVLFETGDGVGGKITIRKGGEKILEENFSDQVKPQKSMF